MSRRPYVFHSLSTCAECGAAGDDFGSPNVEAFEVTGELVCEDCADAILERYAEDFPAAAAQPRTETDADLGHGSTPND